MAVPATVEVVVLVEKEVVTNVDVVDVVVVYLRLSKVVVGIPRTYRAYSTSNYGRCWGDRYSIAAACAYIL